MERNDMARIRQFAKDMGLSYNKAKNLVNKGRKLRDGGSSVLESTMNKVKPVYAKKGKFGKAKVKKEKVLTSSDMPKKKPKNFKKIVEDQKLATGEVTIGDLNESAFPIQNRKDGGGFPDLTGDGKVTKKDILKGRGVPGFSRGGGLAIQGLGFKGVR